MIFHITHFGIERECTKIHKLCMIEITSETNLRVNKIQINSNYHLSITMNIQFCEY